MSYSEQSSISFKPVELLVMSDQMMVMRPGQMADLAIS